VRILRGSVCAVVVLALLTAGAPAHAEANQSRWKPTPLPGWNDNATTLVGVGVGNMYVRRRDGKLWYWAWKNTNDPFEKSWYPTGATVASAPAAARIPGRYDNFVFARRADGTVMATTHDPSADRLGPWTDFGKKFRSGPVAASDSASNATRPRAVVAGVGTDGSVWARIWENGSWGPWTDLGGDPTGGVSVGALDDIWVTARRADGRAWTVMTTTEDTWGKWINYFPDQVIGAPCFFTFSMDGRQYVETFYRNRAGYIVTIDYNGRRVSWPDQKPTSELSCGWRSYVFFRGTNGALWELNIYPGNQTWRSYGGSLTGDSRPRWTPRP